jgi:outer membrane lipopolysaccharide assembly protein LptE/RlpB
VKGACVLFACAALLLCAGCGYHVAGKSNMLPATLHTIAVPPFGNATMNNELARDLGESVSHELIARTKYAVVANPADADAVLYGSVANVFANATTIDPNTGRATGSQITIQLQVRLVDKSGKVLYNRPNLELRDRYEVSTVPSQYFDESQVAFRRLSRSAAQTIVSGILENF